MNKDLNLHEIGEWMKERVNMAIKIIQGQSHAVITQTKVALNPEKGDDIFSQGDTLAQEMYISEIRSEFPDFGIIAEENEFVVPCTHPQHIIYFTADPLDGTKAHARKQSHGVGTMLALVCDGKVVAAYIGNTNTGDIYGYAQHRLGETAAQTYVERIRFGRSLRLVPNQEPLAKRYALLRDNPDKQHIHVRRMIRSPKESGLFKDYEIEGGSIGMSFARLWNGEIGALILRPTVDTPWDTTPIIGISLKLGYRFFELDEENEYAHFLEYDPTLLIKIRRRPYVNLIIHNDQVAELEAWQKKIGEKHPAVWPWEEFP